jgi:kojibiose phosphorylase
METKPRSRPLLYTDWTVIETEFNPELLHPRETIFTIGNGYLSTRGSFEEDYPLSWSTTLIHGVYDQVPLVYTELANCPDWLLLMVSINGERFRLDQGDVLSYERRLDLRSGILSRRVRWRSPSGQTVDLHFERFASLADEHILGLRCQIAPVDFEGMVEIQATINGYAENMGFSHWEWIDQGGANDRIWLYAHTRTSHIKLGMACEVRIEGTQISPQVTSAPGYPSLTAAFPVTVGQTVTVEKLTTVFTSREVTAPEQAAKDKLTELPSYTDLLEAHQQAWDRVWEHSDIVIKGDRQSQLAVRYNLFQLLISAPRYDDRVSIPAKTLSGFGYRGHIFWDTEIFILPFFIYTQPALARNLLTYRYYTLPGARRKASRYGYKGAMFAWESAETGDEVTPRWGTPNDPYAEDIRIWCRDREIHISADIVHAIWSYWQVVGDDEWMRDYGAEIIFDTAIFWMSRVEWNNQNERYEIRGVIGADEYHEQVDNNAFTNRMVQWHLEKAIFIYDWLRQNFPERAVELEQQLQLTQGRRSRWHDIAANLWIPYDSSTGLMEQFEGFFSLEDINLENYEPRERSMQTILGIEGANKRQVLKQPDVLMLLYLMRQSQEFPYSPDILQKNWNYYAPRTDITYGSSLGPAIHAILAADLGKPAPAYQHFLQAAMVDLEDKRGNAADGIHGAAAGGIWQAVILGFGGIKLTEKGFTATPQLPPNWTQLKFKLHWRGQWQEFDLQNPESKPYPDIRGVIFDLDGVLTDTAEYHYQAWQRLADEEGLPFNRQDNEALRGLSRQDSLMRLVGKRPFPEAKLQEMMDRKNRYYGNLIQNISPADLLPGALPLLEELKQAGLQIAIGSASKNAGMVIGRLGIGHLLDAIADGYSVQRPKPDPDLFLYAANQLGLEPEKCAVVEDAAVGIEAALAANMWAVGLGPVERVGTAHVVLPSLEGVHWSDLRTKLT